MKNYTDLAAVYKSALLFPSHSNNIKCYTVTVVKYTDAKEKKACLH